MKKRILSLILALVMMFSLVQVTVSADPVIVYDDVYALISLQGNGANAQIYNTTGVYHDGKAHSSTAYPMTFLDGFGYSDYLNRGNNTAGAYGEGLYILNKNAVDAQKDDDGYIYAENETPFILTTDLDAKNGILLGSKGNSNTDYTVTLNLPKDYKKLSFVEAAAGTATPTITIKIKYKNEAETTLATHRPVRDGADTSYFSYGQKTHAGLIKGNIIGVSSIDCFNNTSNETRLSFAGILNQGYKIANATTPVSTAYYPGVIELAIDPNKEVEYVSFSSNNVHGSAAILAMTATKLSNAEKLANEFTKIPAVDAFNYSSYMANKTAIDAALASIEALVADGGVLTTEQQAIYDNAVEKSTLYTENEAYGVKELIDALPNADEINLDNYVAYNEDVVNLQGQITDEIEENLNEIDTALLEKLNAVAEKTVLYANTAGVIAGVDTLPAPETVTEFNYNKYTAQVKEIQALIEAGVDEEVAATAVATFTAFNEKYVEMKEKAANLSADTKTKYVPFDLTSVANGKNVTVQEPVGGKVDYSVGGYALPEFLSPQTNATAPQIVLNKKAWDELKASTEDGYIYADNGVPFNFRTELDNKNAINLGGLYWATNFKREASIPVPTGRYKGLQFVILPTTGTSGYNTSMIDYLGETLAVKVVYEDGTVEEQTGWTGQLAYAGYYSEANRSLLEQHVVGSGSTFDVAKSKKIATTFDNTLGKTPNLAYDNNGKLDNYATGMILPVYNIEVDPYKTVKEVVFDYYCRLPLSIMAATGVLPDNDDYYDILTGMLDQVTEASIKTVEGKKVSAEVRVLYDAYVGREDATPLGDAYVEKYNWMVDLLDNYSITVTNADDFTDYEETTITIDFDNPIDTANAKYKTKLFLNGTTIKEGEDYTFSATDRQIKLTVPNDYDYSETYKVTIDATLTDGQGKNFPLGVEYSYEFNPTAPFANKTYTILDGTTEITDINICKGKDAVVTVDYVNGFDEEQPFASVTGLFDSKTNTLIKSYYRQGVIGAGETITDEFTFAVPADENADYELRTFNFNSFAELFDITKAVVK